MKTLILFTMGCLFSISLLSQGTATNYTGNDYIDCSENAITLGTNFTQEAWVYVDNVSKPYQLILGSAFDASANLRPPSIYTASTTGLHFGFANTSGEWKSTELNGPYLNINEWNHYAVTFDGTTYKCYINGVEITFDGSFANGEVPGSNPVQGIGAANSNNYFNGKIDEVRIWNSVRSLDEIREFMNREIPPPYPGELATYYKMNDVSGNTAMNEISAYPDGTLMGDQDWQDSDAFNTWLGTNDSWNTSTNWSRAEVPVAEDNVGIYSDAANDPLVTSLSVDVNSVIMGTATSLNVDLESVFTTDNHYSSTANTILIDGELYVENTLQLDGNIEGEGLVYAGEYILDTRGLIFNLLPANGAGVAGGTWVATQSGGGSIDWFTPTNWNQGIPGQNTSVLIDFGEGSDIWPEIDGDIAECKRLNLHGLGANLVISTTGVLNILKNGTPNGKLTVNQGNCAINGGTLNIRNIIIDQGNLTIQNSGTIQVNEDVEVLPGGTLNLGTGSVMNIGPVAK